MARGSFGRTVARAAASGGSRSYRAQRPRLWYLLMFVICVGGVGLIVYSRNETFRKPAVEGPTASDNWYAALAVDICGRIEPNLPASTNLAATGLRTYGDGLINASPGSLQSGASAYEGKNATLGLFAEMYAGFTLTPTELQYPGKGQQTWKDGDRCRGVDKGKGMLVAKVWASSTATVGTTVTDPTKIHISQGEMITVAFVPRGTAIPEPPAKTRVTLVETITGRLPTTTSTTLPGAKK